MPLWLVGMMGSGKSRVGRIVARRTGATFLDTDAMVTEESGRSIAEIFSMEGEPAFRELEAKAVEHAAGRGRAVVATGGGAVLRPANVERMQGSGTVVWLEASPETLAARVPADGMRPLLTADEPAAARLAALLEERAPAYEAAARFRVTTDGRAAAAVAEEVLGLWNGS